MSAGNNSSKLSNNSPDIYEEELITWLQYPIDDGFERNYCSDLFREWPPTAEAAKAHPDVNPPAGSSVDMGINPSAGSGSSKLPTKKKMASKPLGRSSSKADEALALGAERAAGRSSQVGLGAFNKVRTSMKSQANSQRSTSCSSLKAFDDKNHLVKPTLPVPSVPYACKPIEVGAILSSPNIPRLYMPNTLSMEKTRHATSESTTFTPKRLRKDFKTQSQLSYTWESGSSRITEDDIIERGKMTCGDRKFKRTTPHSGSDGSQTSMSLSFKEVTYIGKRRLDDSDFLSDDADVEYMDIRKPCKPSSRRNRVAEIHNLSERNRRNRINEKLKALQDLIPNSSKIDKASMLDEAIEYTKTLQMQLQMVSMRSGMNVSPIGMPMALPQTPLHMAPLESVGLGVPIGHAGMAMGLGVGMDIGFPVNLPQYCAARPFQVAPTTMSQYGMPFQNGSSSGLQDGNQVFAHTGFVHSQSMQNFQEPPDQMHPMSPSASYVEQCQQQEQGQDLGHPSLNHKHEAQSNEQGGISGQKDWKRR